MEDFFQEQKTLNLLPKLKLFEVVVVLSFLTPKEKLLIISLLSRSWKKLMIQPFAWGRQSPLFKHTYLLPHYISLLSQLQNLDGFSIRCSEFFICDDTLPLLKKATDIKILENRLSTHVASTLRKNPSLLSKISQGPVLSRDSTKGIQYSSHYKSARLHLMLKQTITFTQIIGYKELESLELTFYKGSGKVIKQFNLHLNLLNKAVKHFRMKYDSFQELSFSLDSIPSRLQSLEIESLQPSKSNEFIKALANLPFQTKDSSPALARLKFDFPLESTFLYPLEQLANLAQLQFKTEKGVYEVKNLKSLRILKISAARTPDPSTDQFYESVVILSELPLLWRCTIQASVFFLVKGLHSELKCCFQKLQYKMEISGLPQLIRCNAISSLRLLEATIKEKVGSILKFTHSTLRVLQIQNTAMNFPEVIGRVQSCYPVLEELKLRVLIGAKDSQFMIPKQCRIRRITLAQREWFNFPKQSECRLTIPAGASSLQHFIFSSRQNRLILKLDGHLPRITLQECASFEIDPLSEGSIEHTVLQHLNRAQNDSTLHSLKWCRRAHIQRIAVTKYLSLPPLPRLEELTMTQFPMTSQKLDLITKQATQLKKLTLIIPVGVQEEVNLISDSLVVIIVVPKEKVKRLRIKGEARPVIKGAEIVEYQ